MVGQVVPPKQVALVALLTVRSEESISNPQKGGSWEALDLQSLEEWPELEREQARELLLEWQHLFAHSNLDLGRTTLIKHKIKVTDWMPFKDCY